MDVRNVPNQPVTTAFPIRDAIKDWRPGAYFVIAWAGDLNVSEPPEDTRPAGTMAGMWVVDTDLALSSLTGSDGVTVLARTLSTANARADLELALLARSGEEIARVRTDAQGQARFPAAQLAGRGAGAAVAVMAIDPSARDFTRLELTRAPLDLSDRGIEGRDPPGPVDAFLFTERGVYRPGETVRLTALVRDDAGRALAPLPVTLVVRRPDGSEFRRLTATPQNAGALIEAIEMPKSARRGRWTVTAHLDPKAPPVGRVEFAIEDFVPEKLKVSVRSATALLSASEAAAIDVAAEFLYGAPGAGLDVELEARLTLDDRPFARFGAFRFGTDAAREAFEPRRMELKAPETDERGNSRATWTASREADSDLPLKALIVARVFEPGGGRSTRSELSLPVRSRARYIGLRPTFEGRAAREGTEAGFEIVALDRAGEPLAARGVPWKLERITFSYQWFQVDGRWRWQAVTGERIVASGTVDVAADRPATLSRQLGWGHYRLTVGATGDAASSLAFDVGWYGGGASEPPPDQLRVASDRPAYAPGEKARLRIEPGFAGEAVVAIATDRVRATYSVRVPAEGATIEVPIGTDWGPGAYALVTAWRPLGAGSERAPVRAVGAVWLGVESRSRTLAVEIGTPERMVPRQRLDVPLRVAGVSDAEVFVTLAAVDEGILQLTRYRSPRPAEHYFGKRRLGLALRDDYGRLLDGRADDVGRLRTGGDSGDIGGLDVIPTRTVALFAGPVRLDREGRATIPLEVPDFVGQLRLMAVAWDSQRVGSGEAKLIVRDAVATDLVLPRFLAPGDETRLSVSLHNVEGPAGPYRLTLDTEGAVRLAQPVRETRTLAAGQRELLSYALRAGDPGVGKVTLALEGPGGFAVRRSWDIQSRATQAAMAQQTMTALEPGRELTVTPDVADGFVAGTSQVSISLSRTPGIDVPALLGALDRYPFGCLEQTTSRALPLLYYNDVALLAGGRHTDATLPQRLQEAIYRIADMQNAAGHFGMWGPGLSPAAEWLQVYALDFLQRASERRFAVPAASLQRGLAWLSASASKFDANAQAYALYVLGKAGVADPGRVRYFQDHGAAGLRGALAWGHLAAALNLAGEPGRARLAFAEAVRRIGDDARHDYYGSPLRDRAALLALAPEAGGREGASAILPGVRERLTANIRTTTTQEQAWLLLAAHALASGGGELNWSLNGERRTAASDPAIVNPSPADLAGGIRVRNDGQRPVYVQVVARGIPREPQPPASEGISLQRRFFTLDGKPADLSRLRQNERLVVVLNGQARDRSYHEVALVDLLPAGFEIESVLTDESRKAYRFLEPLTPTRIAEARDDRFFVALDLGQRSFRFGDWIHRERETGRPDFSVAYVVRATRAGSFALPAPQLEDMYNPRFHARGSAGRVTIAPR